MYPLWKLPGIKLAPDPIFNIGTFQVTNTLLCTWITIAVLFVLLFLGTRRRDMIPRGMQNFVEWAVETLLRLVEGVAGKEKGKRFFPLVATFFVFILFSNLLDIIPGVDTIGAIDGPAIQALHTSSQPVFGFLLFGDISSKLIPWVRPATSDLNLTLAMAIISVLTTQVLGFYYLGAGRHLSKYFNFPALFKGGTGIIEFIAGLIEIVSEIARVISFSFRLFGNIFAGSALLAVFAFLLPVFADVIFIPFELFVAFVQALVFALLTLVFMEIATTSHAEHTEPGSAEEDFIHNKAEASAATH